MVACVKRPAFQFYPADWRMDSNLRRCSHAARGAWMDILCILHDSEEYGVYRWRLAELANTAGVPMKLARELVEKGVLRGADSGADPCTFRPTHAGRIGNPIVLVEPGDGPCWYSKRFVKDEYIRLRRGRDTRFSDDNPPPKTKPKATPKPGFGEDIGEWQGYGPSSSSSTSVLTTTEASVEGSKLPKVAKQRAPDPVTLAKQAMIAAGIPSVRITSHPSLIELVQAGVPPETFGEVARELGEAKGGFTNIGHVCATIRGRLVDAAQRARIPAGTALATNGSHAPSKTRGAIEELERLKHGYDLAPNGSHDGLPEIAVLEPGQDAGA